MIIFIAIYLIALCCYFKTRTSGNIKHRAINKYFMATMYLSLAFVTFMDKYEFASYQTLLIAALILAWLGDIFLVFDFNRGGDFFLAGNICFILYEQAVLIDNGFWFNDFAWTYYVIMRDEAFDGDSLEGNYTRIRVTLTALGDAVELTVADTGAGIPPERQPYVFLRGESDGGHGYGLPIARDLARRMGGELTLRSRPGMGSAFTLRLPIRPAAAV